MNRVIKEVLREMEIHVNIDAGLGTLYQDWEQYKMSEKENAWEV